MDRTNKFVIKKELLYLIFYSSFSAYWFSTYVLSATKLDLTIFNNILFVVGFVFFAIAWILEKNSAKEYILQALFFAFLIFIFIGSGRTDQGILIIFPMIAGMKNTRIKRVTRIMFITYMVLFMFLILLSFFGVVENTVYTKVGGYENYQTIQIGGVNANIIFIIIFAIISAYLYTYIEKINFIKCCILQVLIIPAYFLFYSRTGFITTSVEIWGCYLVSRNIQFNGLKWRASKISIFLLKHSYLIFYIFVYIVGKYFFYTGFGQLLNKLVTSRIYEVNYYVTNFGVGLFPKYVKYYACDNSQTIMFVSYGMIYTFIFLFLNYRTMSVFIQKNKKLEIFFMIVFLFFSYSEFALLKPFANFGMLFLIYAFYPNRNIDDKVGKK